MCVPWKEEHVAQSNEIPTYQEEYVTGAGHRYWETETLSQTPSPPHKTEEVRLLCLEDTEPQRLTILQVLGGAEVSFSFLPMCQHRLSTTNPEATKAKQGQPG